jgi:hypothetical protein
MQKANRNLEVEWTKALVAAAKALEVVASLALEIVHPNQETD